MKKLFFFFLIITSATECWAQQTVFLNYHVKKNLLYPHGRWVLQSENITYQEGVQIEDTATKYLPEGKYLIQQKGDNKGKSRNKDVVYSQTVVDDPLMEKLEVPSETGEIQTVIIEKDEADVSVRVKYHPEFKNTEIKRIKK